MRQMMRFGWFGALPLSVVLLASSVTWAETKAPATITTPHGNSIVERVTQVVFETSMPGVPVVLVSADGEVAEWWVQPPAKATAPGRYAVAAYFGNSKTPQGTPFLVTVLMVPSEREAKLVAEGQVFKQLPTGLAMAKPLRVLRKVEGEATVEPASKTTNPPVVLQATATPTATATLRLENRASVARRQVVHGVQRGEIDPVVLVRATSDNMWWVQDRVQRDAEGAFTGLVRFGNEKTPPGSEFHLLALTPRSSSDASSYKVGDSLKELPKDAIVSAELTLVLAVDDAPGAE
jgi:hypothetical protein